MRSCILPVKHYLCIDALGKRAYKRHMDFRETRKALGLSQAELAEKLGVDQGTVSRYETGEIEMNARMELALEALMMKAKAA